MSVGSKKVFQPRDPSDIQALVENYPLAWILCGRPADFAATPIPVQLRCDGQGNPRTLVGHFARSNPHVKQLEADPDALVLLMGPQAYVSPSWYRNRTSAPSWNYASVAFHVTVVLEEDPATIRKRLEDLVTAMEARHPRPWRIDDMGPRYAQLAQHVVGFHADIHEVRATLKLGQDESDDIFEDCLAGLEASGKTDVASWMRRLARPGRKG